jgi:arylsulfatase
MDIFTTIAGATGLALPPDIDTDGSDLLRYVNNDSLVPHEHLYWQRGASRAIRSGDWKAIWNEEFGDTLLYDLKTDPNEDSDQFSQNKDMARNMVRIHSDWSDRLPAPLWPPVMWFGENIGNRWIYFED